MHFKSPKCAKMGLRLRLHRSLLGSLQRSPDLLAAFWKGKGVGKGKGKRRGKGNKVEQIEGFVRLGEGCFLALKGNGRPP